MSKLTKIARELLTIEEDLPFRFDYKKEDRPSIDDFEVEIFEQTWGSTALGFSGIGGQVITTAHTYVFMPIFTNQDCFVYFSSGFAYSAPYCERLVEDVKNRSMAPVHVAKCRYKKEVQNGNNQ